MDLRSKVREGHKRPQTTTDTHKQSQTAAVKHGQSISSCQTEPLDRQLYTSLTVVGKGDKDSSLFVAFHATAKAYRHKRPTVTEFLLLMRCGR